MGNSITFIKHNLEIRDYVPKPLTRAASEFEAKVDETGLLLKGLVRARDEFSARDQFVASLAQTHSYVSLYRPRSENLIRGRVVLVESPNGKTQTCLDSRPSYAIPLNDASDYTQRLHRTFKARSKLEFADQNRVDSSFQYHSLALSSTVPESRLINLWISLESLIENEATSVIDAVATHVANIAALDYLYRSVHSLGRDIVRLDNYRREIKSMLEGATDYKTPSASLVSILCKQDLKRYKAVVNATQSDAMVSNRIAFLADSVLADPKLLRDRLNKEWDRVNWQVRRIYRERNEIAHRGKTGLILPSLLSHLFAYQSSVLRTLMHDIRRHGADKWSIERCVYYRQTGWTTYRKMLQAKGESITLEGLLAPIEMLCQGERIRAWQAKA